MRRPVFLAAGLGVVAVLVLSLVVWLPGPRAALPGPTGTNLASAGQSGALVPPSSLPRSSAGLPDPKRTPGSINPNVTQANIAATICTKGWTTTVRPPSAYTTSLKAVQIVEYGYSDHKLADYEEDHLVPLELGGAPRDPTNLWPEPNSVELADGTKVGSTAKDKLENYLHARVCGNLMALEDAQRLIAGDWIAAWTDAGRP